MPSTAEARVRELNLILPPGPKPIGVYQPCLRQESLLYVSGHGPLRPDKTLILGRVGENLSLDEGYAAARQVGLAVLATVREALGSLDQVRRIVKTLGWVNCTADFTDQPKVMNGFSELMRDVFGPDAGVGARSAVAAHTLPGGIAVEVECLFALW